VTTSCSVLGERLGEDLAASAPKARRFLLLEQPGPWSGRNAVTHSDLDVGLARALLARADEAGVKVHLIRRSARRAALPRRSCFLADTGRHGPWVQRYELGDPAEVLDLDLGGDPSAAWEDPLYAVCTHGKRDPCCARRGRPLARALRAHRPEQTWEIGHIGGHRFAATFLAFPHGLAFGRVPAAAGPEIVTALEAGEIDLDHLRGRAGDPPVVQAADVLVRRRLGLTGLDDLAVEHVHDGAVTLCRRDGTRLRVTVEAREQPPRPLSCGDKPEPVTAYELSDLAVLDRAA
jgi:hypothetical protein